MLRQYCGDFLSNHMLPFLSSDIPVETAFQHNNDPKHTSQLVQAWFADKYIKVMRWPVRLPNPIENL